MVPHVLTKKMLYIGRNIHDCFSKCNYICWKIFIYIKHVIEFIYHTYLEVFCFDSSILTQIPALFTFGLSLPVAAVLGGLGGILCGVTRWTNEATIISLDFYAQNTFVTHHETCALRRWPEAQLVLCGCPGGPNNHSELTCLWACGWGSWELTLWF